MMKIKSLDDLNRYREAVLRQRTIDSETGQIKLILSMGTPAIAAGARATMRAILDFIADQDLKNVSLTQTGNIGFDSLEPIMQVKIGEEPKVAYGMVSADVARRIMSEHVVGGMIVKDVQIEI